VVDVWSGSIGLLPRVVVELDLGFALVELGPGLPLAVGVECPLLVAGLAPGVDLGFDDGYSADVCGDERLPLSSRTLGGERVDRRSQTVIGFDMKEQWGKA